LSNLKNNTDTNEGEAGTIKTKAKMESREWTENKIIGKE
jgi:hypothetical protein